MRYRGVFAAWQGLERARDMCAITVRKSRDKAYNKCVIGAGYGLGRAVVKPIKGALSVRDRDATGAC